MLCFGAIFGIAPVAPEVKTFCTPAAGSEPPILLMLERCGAVMLFVPTLLLLITLSRRGCGMKAKLLVPVLLMLLRVEAVGSNP